MTLTAIIEDVHRMTPDVNEFRLVVDDHRFEFDPGQHTEIHFENDGEEESQPYTAVNRPGTNQLVLAIKRYDDGNCSIYMHDRTPGDEIEIESVDGNLYARNLERDAIFVATGTGITPLYPIFRQYAQTGDGTAHLLFGGRDQEHIVFRESLDQLRGSRDHVSAEYVLSDAESGWNGRTGHVQDYLESALESVDNGEPDCYVCGVPEMVVETTDALQEAGIDEFRIHTEGWESDAASEGDRYWHDEYRGRSCEAGRRVPRSVVTAP
jgi:ferredoxin-NADP reductase